MKKIIGLLLVFVSIITFTTACGKDKINYLVIVNKQNKLPSDWEEKLELVDVKTGLDETYQVEKEAAEKFNELRDALLKEGVTIELDSTYRSVKRQQEIWDEFEKEKGLAYAQKYVAVPGYSEHHTGLALDVKLVKDGKVIDDNDDMIAERDTFAKVHAKLADFGFILRYLEGKDSITGYAYEPWHLRYVGSTSVAKEIMEKGLTLEEYLKIDYSPYMGYQFSGKDPWDNILAVTIRKIEGGKIEWTYTSSFGKDISLYHELSTDFNEGKTTFTITDKKEKYSYEYTGNLVLKDNKIIITYEDGSLTTISTEGNSDSNQVKALDNKEVSLTKVIDNN